MATTHKGIGWGLVGGAGVELAVNVIDAAMMFESVVLGNASDAAMVFESVVLGNMSDACAVMVLESVVLGNVVVE